MRRVRFEWWSRAPVAGPTEQLTVARQSLSLPLARARAEYRQSSPSSAAHHSTRVALVKRSRYILFRLPSFFHTHTLSLSLTAGGKDPIRLGFRLASGNPRSPHTRVPTKERQLPHLTSVLPLHFIFTPLCISDHKISHRFF